jgi:hypothetical protein
MIPDTFEMAEALLDSYNNDGRTPEIPSRQNVFEASKHRVRRKNRKVCSDDVNATDEGVCKLERFEIFRNYILCCWMTSSAK